jgi:hypothetical protein
MCLVLPGAKSQIEGIEDMAKTEKTAQKRFCEVGVDANGEISRLTLKCEQLEQENKLLRVENERLAEAKRSLETQLDAARQGRWDQRTCKACGKLVERAWWGREREYCSNKCRQRAYRERKRVLR